LRELAVSAPQRARLSLCLAFVAAVTVCSPASAQGLMEFLFGSRPASAVRASTGSTAMASATNLAPSSAVGRSTTYCVRLCDGRFFPIQPAKAATTAQLCTALCPASPTKTFHGSEIRHAVAADGTRYAALANAFAYRARIAPGCTCNGKDHFGLATLAIGADPTLRAGDMVMTRDGVLTQVR
jgi:Protein of unknown function (DUF2865)